MRRPFPRRTFAGFAVLVAALSGGACGDEGPAGPEAGHTVADVTSDPASLEGIEVAISGTVGEVYGPNALALQDGEGGRALVVAEERIDVVEASTVRVIGRVEALPPEDATLDEVVDRIADVIDEEGFGHAVVATQIEVLDEPVGYSLGDPPGVRLR